MNVAYIRVSTIDQNFARQHAALEKYKIDKIFEEKISGKDTNRPKLQEMLEWVREGDTVYISEYSRLARNTVDLLSIEQKLSKKGVVLVSDKDKLDTSTPTGKFMLTVLAGVAELERAMIKERQLEGIAEAKKRGVYAKKRKHLPDDFESVWAEYKKRLISKAELARRLNMSRPTLDNLLKAGGYE